MTMSEFRLLSEPDKIAIIYEDGVYIGKRKEAGISILIYQLDKFYVEVYYRVYRKNIWKLRCSSSTTILDPYLEQIEVEAFVNG